MESQIDLLEYSSIKKVKEVVESSSVCLFVTNLTVTPITSAASAAHQVDSDGTLWFLSNASSSKNREIADDSRVQLFFSNKRNSEYLSIYGKASIVTDRDQAVRRWNPEAGHYFEGGIEDPELTLLKVQPVNAHYWDTKANKMISLVKMMASAMTGKALDESHHDDFGF